MKYIITFGGGQLPEFMVNPLKVMLVIEAPTEHEARQLVMNTEPIFDKWCTSYDYEAKAEEFQRRFKMQEYTLEELLALRG
jgi:hypothetical protein